MLPVNCFESKLSSHTSRLFDKGICLPTTTALYPPLAKAIHRPTHRDHYAHSDLKDTYHPCCYHWVLDLSAPQPLCSRSIAHYPHALVHRYLLSPLFLLFIPNSIPHRPLVYPPPTAYPYGMKLPLPWYHKNDPFFDTILRGRIALSEQHGYWQLQLACKGNVFLWDMQ